MKYYGINRLGSDPLFAPNFIPHSTYFLTLSMASGGDSNIIDPAITFTLTHPISIKLNEFLQIVLLYTPNLFSIQLIWLGIAKTNCFPPGFMDLSLKPSL